MVQGLISKYGKTSIYLKSKDFVYNKRIGLNDRYRQCLWLIWMFYPRWTLMWKDNVKFAVSFQNMHDTLGSKCKHGVKEVANSVIVCSSIQADFLHITRLIVWCSSPKKGFLLRMIRRKLYELSSIATSQRACDKLHVGGFDGHHLAAKICNFRLGFIFLYYFSK